MKATIETDTQAEPEYVDALIGAAGRAGADPLRRFLWKFASENNKAPDLSLRLLDVVAELIVEWKKIPPLKEIQRAHAAALKEAMQAQRDADEALARLDAAKERLTAQSSHLTNRSTRIEVARTYVGQARGPSCVEAVKKMLKTAGIT